MLFPKPYLLFLTYITSALGIAVLDKRACNADNCARAVTGTAGNPPLSSKKADCSSFLRRTVTPDVVTSTSTVTVTSPVANPVEATSTRIVTITQTATASSVQSVDSTSVFSAVETDVTTITAATISVTSDVPETTLVARNEDALFARAVTQTNTAVPAYASACSGAVRYSSACSCFGVIATTTTLVPSTTYTTATITQSSTSTTTSGTTTLSITQPTTITTTLVTTTTLELDVTSTSTLISTSLATATSTLLQSCPTQVIQNGGFESGSIAPFTFSNSPNFFENPGGDIQVITDPTLAHSGNDLASVVETDSSLGGLSFNLSQIVQVCPGASYTLTFYTSSQVNSAGATQCNLMACVGGTCATFDPSTGDKPEQAVDVVFPGTTDSSVDVVVYTPEVFEGTGITFCGREFVRFDDFSLTLNA